MHMRVSKLCHSNLTVVKQKYGIIYQDHQAEDTNNKDHPE